MAKIRMVVFPEQLQELSTTKPETGMGFQIVDTPTGIVAVLESGRALPCYHDKLFYDVNDLVAGVPIPKNYENLSLNVLRVFANRLSSLAALQAAGISPKFTGNAGAIPLIASYVLTQDTIFYRRLSSSVDNRYVAGQLTAGSYLTTSLDQAYANSGFATVSRYSLPIPLPASHVVQYELPHGTTINAGTVAPMFGQAGGGVEVQLPSSQTVKKVGASVVADY